MAIASRARNAFERRLFTCAAFTAVAMATAATAHAEKGPALQVLTAGAIKQVVSAVGNDYQKDTGQAVNLDNDTAGALVKRVEGGASCDVIVLPPSALKGLADKGLIENGSAHPIARVGIGVAVRAGAGKPDISTVDAFKTAILAVPTVAYIDPASGGSSGVYLTGLFKKMGIEREMASRAVLVQGGLVADKLVDGQAALAIHQISEILVVRGASLVGPLPAEIQSYTSYSAAICAKAVDRKGAAAFTKELHTPAARAIVKSKGMEPLE